jgi:hypothetical protein
MRRELTWLAATVLALIVGATCARGYARLATPYYRIVAQALAATHPWTITDVIVINDQQSGGTVLRLTADVRRHSDDPWPAARVLSRVQVGEVIETPIVFWTLVLLWPARRPGQRLRRLAAALPVFACLEAMTTAVQLIHPLPEASALLAGEQQPLSLLERWSRFLEAGGRFALEVSGALWVVACASLWDRSVPRAVGPHPSDLRTDTDR